MKKPLFTLFVIIITLVFIVGSDFSDDLPQVDPNVSYVVYFYVDACRDCERTELFFETLPESITITGSLSTVQITKRNIFSGDNVSLYMEMISAYDVPEQEQSVPILFLTSSYLSGYENIKENLSANLISGDGLSFSYPSQGSPHLPITPSDLWGFFLAGLIGGVNPCSISLLFLLLSLLASSKKSIISAGLTFVAARFLAYLIIGLSIYTVATGLDLAWLSAVTGVVNIVLIVAAVVVAVLNFVDCIHLLRKSNARILMQLPVSLRRFNQRIMKKFLTPEYAAFLLPVIFVIGLIISGGEFLCTGQVYLASILYTLQRGVGNEWMALVVFLTYIIAMCIPPTIIIIAVSKGRSILMLSDSVQERLWLIKLINGILFIAFAVLLLVLFS
jgi:hypothetical protein